MTGSLKTFLQTGHMRAEGSSTNFISFPDMIYNVCNTIICVRFRGGGLGAVDQLTMTYVISHVAEKDYFYLKNKIKVLGDRRRLSVKC